MPDAFIHGPHNYICMLKHTPHITQNHKPTNIKFFLDIIKIKFTLLNYKSFNYHAIKILLIIW